MKLLIQDRETTGEVKKNFAANFPFLRIDFFRPIAGDVPYSALRIQDDNVTIGSIRNIHHEGSIIIHADDITGEVEKKFEKEFGLHVQIFRRSGKQWILTTKTDGLSLRKQNEIGEEMSTLVAPPEPEDVHEQP